MSTDSDVSTPKEYKTLEEYVDDNHDALVRVLKHGTDSFARACALVALLEGGTVEDRERTIDELEQAIDRLKEDG